MAGRSSSLGLWLLLVALTLNCGAQFDLDEKLVSQVEAAYGNEVGGRVRSWVRLIAIGSSAQETGKLRLVNDFFNRLRQTTDQQLWGRQDYWATPVETLAMNAGDCEDFSLAKYFTLRAMGVADDKLHITYVKALELGEAHMVLAYYADPDGEPLILDNLKPDILPASRRLDLSPVYSFNAMGLWGASERARGRRMGPATQLGLWKDLLARMADFPRAGS